MKVIIKPENETLQLNLTEPFNQYESTVDACPRIGEKLNIENKGQYLITDIRHDLSIFSQDTYSIGETIMIVEKIE